MSNFLTFSVYAPIGAMGALALGGNRYGWDRPARSALLGMIAATLGIERQDEDQIQALESAIGLAVLVENSGTQFFDFHTAVVPKGNGQWRTRADEIADADNTIVSSREYRTNVACLIAITSNDPRYSLEIISDALKRPVFAPFFGRKSCSLGLPFDPVIIEAENFVEALLERRKTGREQEFLKKMSRQPYITMDAADAAKAGIEVHRIESRTDKLISRSRWQFRPRREAIILVKDTETETTMEDDDVFEQSQPAA